MEKVINTEFTKKELTYFWVACELMLQHYSDNLSPDNKEMYNDLINRLEPVILENK